jgi:hypothetical protein
MASSVSCADANGTVATGSSVAGLSTVKTDKNHSLSKLRRSSQSVTAAS